MKRILGLDLGTGSIGWALVEEAENNTECSAIINMGVRVNPLTVDEQLDFKKGKSITTNADRTLKRSARRNLQRYKLRRGHLMDCLRKNGLITDTTPLYENGPASTFETYRLRAKAVTEEITLEEFARVLLMLNKKRGYKSSRKMQSAEDGQAVDSMEVVRRLYEEGITPGQYVLPLLENGGKYIPDFYRSDLLDELDKIWAFQQNYHPEVLTDDFRRQLQGKSMQSVSKLFREKYDIDTAEYKGKEKRLQEYRWRVAALSQKLPVETVALVIGIVNGAVTESAGDLGSISDRSKELFFSKLTVGQYLMKKLDENPNFSLKNTVFYRSDYLDEFETIWKKQSEYHTELTPELKKEIRDNIIFYQRALKSQKSLVSFCEFESKSIKINVDGKLKQKTVGYKVCPKSSPLFQEFKIWQTLNNLRVIDRNSGEATVLSPAERNLLFQELNVKKELSKTKILSILDKRPKAWDLNYEKLDGNRTRAALFEACQKILAIKGVDEYDFSTMSAVDIEKTVTKHFTEWGYNVDILFFDATKEGKELDKQPMYLLWHLLYSFENDSVAFLVDKIKELCHMDEESAVVMSKVVFLSEYGNLSTRAIRKILPYLKEGYKYSDACDKAGYRHSSRSLTKEELQQKEYKEHLELLPRNSLRNPVVEKILNQMIHVVNAVIDTYGKPDEIRIELARELKKSAKEREEMTKSIAQMAKKHDEYREILRKKFPNLHVSQNDILRYKLYKELESNGYKTLYSDTYISLEKLFLSKEFDIEHIIPQSRLFDDSFSNKTLESRSVNIDKGNDTAYDYVLRKGGEQMLESYKNKITDLYQKRKISKTKYRNLMMRGEEIPEDFINRDLRDSQYIARKAQEMLEDLVPVVVPTTGSVTARLRKDWQLEEVMQELNWNKYHQLGLTEVYSDKDGREICRIKEWTKRNDHRHHAVDALVIAFTKRAFIQYLNNMNARSDKSGSIYAIEQKSLFRDDQNKLRFIPPMPANVFRAETKRHLENLLISLKAKNKVVTLHLNKTKHKGGLHKKVQLTPRGKLHEETIYGSLRRYVVKEKKIGAEFDAGLIAKVAKKRYRKALLKRLAAFGNDPKNAFTGKNSLSKNPLYLDDRHIQQVPEKVKIVEWKTIYTIRKEIAPDLKVEKVIDAKVRQILEERLAAFNGDAKKAFSNLDENPIWLNKEKNIVLKRVTIRAVNNVIALHDKKDHKGKYILDAEGKKQPVDFVNTGNNHHVAVYRDEKGELQDRIVSFCEATACVVSGGTVIDKEYKKSEGWTFLFSMKQNEYFVFPNEKSGFNPQEIDLTDPDNYAAISPNLYRVQKFSKVASRIYVFRHHLETSVDDDKALKEIAYKVVCSLKNLEGVVKVRVNHLGQIVAVGEY
ncbi:MAG: type II CRISPR RNA-guided endonuclease Cas9 [Coprobacter sp.]|nr:type II CRISPR RNA-guided endonuclease Cas9 [Coprobacter sp.]